MRTSDILEILTRRGISYTKEKFKDMDISGYSSLFRYRHGTLTFIVPERRFDEYIENFKEQKIAFIILGQKENVYDCFENAIRVDDPRKAFFAVIEDCFDIPDDSSVNGISSDPQEYRKYSYIAPSARIGKNVRIGVGCVIEGNVVIGDDTEIHHNVVIRNKTKIGKRCTIHSGVVIGEYGFGYTRNEKNEKTMLKHYGGVTIEDDVHIGDNSVIIRGAIDDTIIHKGVKINTMVHIAHNDEIGENTLIASAAHICGSVKIGENCHIAGTTIRNQRTVGDYATIGLGAVVVKDVKPGSVVVGNPAKPMKK